MNKLLQGYFNTADKNQPCSQILLCYCRLASSLIQRLGGICSFSRAWLVLFDDSSQYHTAFRSTHRCAQSYQVPCCFSLDASLRSILPSAMLFFARPLYVHFSMVRRVRCDADPLLFQQHPGISLSVSSSISVTPFLCTSKPPTFIPSLCSAPFHLHPHVCQAQVSRRRPVCRLGCHQDLSLVFGHFDPQSAQVSYDMHTNRRRACSSRTCGLRRQESQGYSHRRIHHNQSQILHNAVSQVFLCSNVRSLCRLQCAFSCCTYPRV